MSETSETNVNATPKTIQQLAYELRAAKLDLARSVKARDEANRQHSDAYNNLYKAEEAFRGGCEERVHAWAEGCPVPHPVETAAWAKLTAGS